MKKTLHCGRYFSTISLVGLVMCGTFSPFVAVLTTLIRGVFFGMRAVPQRKTQWEFVEPR